MMTLFFIYNPSGSLTLSYHNPNYTPLRYVKCKMYLLRY